MDPIDTIDEEEGKMPDISTFSREGSSHAPHDSEHVYSGVKRILFMEAQVVLVVVSAIMASCEVCILPRVIRN
jgi:hypothetical protein